MQLIVMAMFGQVIDTRGTGSGSPTAPIFAVAQPVSATAEVTDETLEMHVQPEESSYTTGVLARGDQVKIRGHLDSGWVAIEPPANAICWVDASAIESPDNSDGRNSHVAEAAVSTSGLPTRATIASSQAVVRSGNLKARMPGPPAGHLSRGTTVRVIDRRPLVTGRGKTKIIWYAIVPPPEVVFYIQGDGTRLLDTGQTRADETQAVYRPARYAAAMDEYAPLDGVPASVAAEIKTADAVHQSIRTSQPVNQWRFETVRTTYQSILKKAGTDPHVEEAVRVRLARVTRDEQAAQAARTIEEILAQSHRRDEAVAVQKRRVAAAGRSSARAFNAIGYMQASTEKIDGRKLFVLIGKDGSTLAYLDIPPGLDIDRLVAHRVGVRGDPHYSEELGSRLITVRDLERMESRR